MDYVFQYNITLKLIIIKSITTFGNGIISLQTIFIFKYIIKL